MPRKEFTDEVAALAYLVKRAEWSFQIRHPGDVTGGEFMARHRGESLAPAWSTPSWERTTEQREEVQRAGQRRVDQHRRRYALECAAHAEAALSCRMLHTEAVEQLRPSVIRHVRRRMNDVRGTNYLGRNDLPLRGIPVFGAGDYMGRLSLEESNRQEWREALPSGEDRWWTEETGSHGYSRIVVFPDLIGDELTEDEPAVIVAANLLARHENYPSLSDDRWSEIEHDMEEKAWTADGCADYIRAAAKLLPEVMEDGFTSGWAARYADKARSLEPYLDGEEGNGGSFYFRIDEHLKRNPPTLPRFVRSTRKLHVRRAA